MTSENIQITVSEVKQLIKNIEFVDTLTTFMYNTQTLDRVKMAQAMHLMHDCKLMLKWHLDDAQVKKQ